MSISSNVLPGASLLAPLIAACVAMVAIVAMLRFRHVLPMDEPNHRSLHTAPIPRSGGLGIMAGVLVAWVILWAYGSNSIAPLMLGFVLCAFSLIDDVRGLPVALRFATQLLVATILLLMLDVQAVLPGGLLGLVPLVLAVGWMTNLYNFMDGSNGLAGGMAFFGFGFLGLAALLAGDPAFALVSISVALAAGGFLLFNFHPARIFMGDGGSVPLGFLAAAIGVMGWQQKLWPALLPVIVFAPFVVDATVTLIRRGLRREKVWQAHREHYYQRLIRMGWSHRKLALAEYVLMVACGTGALYIRNAPPVVQAMVAALFLVIFAVIMDAVDRAWAKSNAS